MGARFFGEKLCEKTASDWSAAQLKDDTTKTVVNIILAGATVEDVTNAGIPETVDR